MSRKAKNVVRAAVLVALVVIATATAAVTLTEEESAECEAEGGCALISKAVLLQLLGLAYEEGKAEAQATCRNRT
jgi:hypothetical protein